MDRITKVIVRGVVAPAFLAALVTGCQNDQSASSSSSSEGRVVSQTERRDITPEGTEVQTKTQVRETPEGQRIRETEMRTREDVTPERNTGN